MKKLFSLSVCLSASTILLAASPSFSQTITVPITGTTIGLNVFRIAFDSASPISFPANNTVLTPLGAVNLNVFNGIISANSVGAGSGSFNVVGSQITNTSGFQVFFNGATAGPTTFVFTGTTNGTASFVPNNAFTSAPTTINATFPADPILPGPTTVNVPITGGSITLPEPPPVVVVPPPVTCEGCLIVRPELLIANSTFLSPDLQEPEYRQEYKNDFSASSFRGGRILALEDK